MREYIVAFLQKQKGKSLADLIAELTVRGLSLCIFPLLYFILAAFTLIKPLRVGFLYHERMGHLALNTDLYLRRRYLGINQKDGIHVFFVYSPANQQLVRMFSRKMVIVNSEIAAKLFAPIGLFRTRFWIPLPFIGNEFHEFNNAPPQITFTDAEQQEGLEFLRRLGIGPTDWYACIFARDHSYYRTFSPHADLAFSDHRNADIDTYEQAIKAVLDAGGWVIRMGSCVEKPLRFRHPRVIDYASQYREDFADIYLTAHARFFVGTTSGASDISVLFDVPFVGVNWVPIGYSPFGKNSIFIPKRIASQLDGTQVPMALQLKAFTGNQVTTALIPEHVLQERNWKFIDNTPQEIGDVVLEMIQRLDGHFNGTNPEYLRRLARYRAILPEQNIYRENRSPIGLAMLLSLDLGDNDS